MSVTGPNDPDTAYPHHEQPAAPAGGGTVAWFAGSSLPSTELETLTPQWANVVDGLFPGTDVQIDEDDSTKLHVYTAGTYLFVAEAVAQPDLDGDPAELELTAALNDDSVGPLRLLKGYAVATQGVHTQLRIVAPVSLVVDDLVSVTLTAVSYSFRIFSARVMMVRLA